MPEADTGTGGLFNGGSYAAGGVITGFGWGTGTPGTFAPPYVVMRLSHAIDDATNADTQNVTVQFRILDAAASGDVNIRKIQSRLYGDAVLQAGRIPTFGFHRHVLVLGTNDWNAAGGQCLIERQSVDMDTENIIEAQMDMTLNISAVAVSP